MTALPLLRLRSGAHQRVRSGHLWVFRDELESPVPQLEPGALVQVHTSYGYDLGVGFYHPTSKIAVRLLAWHGEVDLEFFCRRIERALRLRESFYGTSTMYRLVFSEADFLPGLIVDRYDKWCAVQFLSAGMDSRRSMIVEALRRVIPSVRGIIAKNDTVLREKEGLPRQEEMLWGEVPPVITVELDNVQFALDIIGGQKTGLYLDQRLNYQLVSRFATGRRVLDCFTHHGGFALFCLLHGAASATGVDSSSAALELARQNAMLNGVAERCTFIEADVFNFLKQATTEGQQWDMVILDPPAFAKSVKHVPQALRGYAEINRRALQLLEDGGILVSASCSHYITEQMLLETILAEARRVACRVCLLARGMQSPCHPVYTPMPQTQYLKVLVFEVVRL